MARPLVLATVLVAGLAAAGLPAPAAAQSDPAAQELIERLRPGGQTRGIRLPGQQTPAPAEPTATGPTLTPAQPGGVAPPVAATPVPAPAPRPTSVQPATTAPPELPAVSLMITFASGSARLTPEAERTLASLGRALASPELAPFRFRIEGHTDTTGPREMNQMLSEARAATVRDYLISRFGIAPQRLVAVGYGETQLLVPTADEVPEARNRRVQIVNIGN
ncbi:MAG: OmpA family protein [Acetobacteraceae bacterium]|nr:OmpA family protein [Acetobacteraceae bacterium]MCX7685321.1 OmpA family protein [Acetobacteraceae bacterium]MDW8397814.1 OmpA family protein [Acetobacteraceae bacterium]